MYNPSRRPRHPVAVAELNDANSLRSLANRTASVLDELSAQGAREAAMYSIQVLNAAAKRLTNP